MFQKFRPGWHLRLVYARPILAAVSLLISGLITSLMMQQFAELAGGQGVLPRSRLWWELVLNVQILCIGMMWFYYSDRVPETSGPRRRYFLVRSSLSVFTVSIPGVIAGVAAFNNWFEFRPEPSVLFAFSSLLICYWAAGLFLHGQIIVTHTPKGLRPEVRVRWWFFVPFLLLLLVMLCDALFDGINWVVLTPALLSIQAATPYLLKAFNFVPFCSASKSG